MTGKRRLQNRRIDWLLWILIFHVAEEFIVRAFAEADGSVSNLRAYKAMNNAILAAKHQIQDAASHGSEDPVKMAGNSAKVKSAKDSTVEYEVMLPEEGSDNITCSCQAGRFKAMCWHVAAVLLRKGASENLLLRHMGVQLGSKSGGYQQLMHGMSAAAAAAAADAAIAVAAGLATSCEESSIEDEPAMTVDEPARAEDEARAGAEADARVPGPSAQLASQSQRKSARSEAEAALAKLAAVGRTWSDNDSNWKWLALATNKALEDVDRMVSNARVSGLEKSNSCPTFLTNADAPADFSLKRKKTMLEECALKRKAANAVAGALPFVPLSLPVKPRSELQAIQAKNKQLGIVSAASAPVAAMQRSNSAPQLPRERASPVAPDVGGCPSSNYAATAEPLQVSSSIPLHRMQATQSPSRRPAHTARSSRVKSRPSRFRDGAS